ncbi:hypothetical protein H0H87_002208, partial [Tephrocybe sp. NHM501043]
MVLIDASILGRPAFAVPQLSQVRDILARLQGPIISTVISRAALPVEPELYSSKGRPLMSFIHNIEASYPERFAYGSLEFPFTLPNLAPDVTTSAKSFPGGIFHQDTFSPNRNLTSFYLKSLLPLLAGANNTTGGTSVFFHISNKTNVVESAAKLTLDAQLLALLSHRACIGKLVA